MDIDDKSCWRQAFFERNEKRYLIIKKDEKKVSEGFALHYSFPDEEKEIVLDNPENIENHSDFKKYLRLRKTYINIEKGIVIEDYDTKLFENYIKELISKK
jgi:hypothetical protein